MNEIYLICDESGSKGFSDKDEMFEGEFGVFAGYFLNEKNFQQMLAIFESIYCKYPVKNGKLHITDLDKTLQEQLRADIFEIFIKNKIPCVYEAISVKGYKGAADRIADIKNESIKALNKNYSFSKNPHKDRLHSELFQAIFGKSIAYLLDFFANSKRIIVITDNIDAPLKKEFENKAIELIKPFLSGTEIKAFDKNKKRPVSKEMKFGSTELENDDISNIGFEINVEDNSLTLIADILANSIHYYFKTGDY